MNAHQKGRDPEDESGPRGDESMHVENNTDATHCNIMQARGEREVADHERDAARAVRLLGDIAQHDKARNFDCAMRAAVERQAIAKRMIAREAAFRSAGDLDSVNACKFIAAKMRAEICANDAQSRDKAERVEAIEKRCESPLEVELVRALLRAFDVMAARAPAIGEGVYGRLYQQYGVSLGPDLYRLDFAILKGSLRVAVEVDGFEFHDATPETAERDKARDRALVAAGWRVLRFSGREVHRSAHACVDQVFATIEALEARSTNGGL